MCRARRLYKTAAAQLVLKQLRYTDMLIPTFPDLRAVAILLLDTPHSHKHVQVHTCYVPPSHTHTCVATFCAQGHDGRGLIASLPPTSLHVDVAFHATPPQQVLLYCCCC